jgi:formamidopyrimidine-DNA glycosylase
MPELPEVETVRRQLESAVVGRSIRGLRVRFAGRLNRKPTALAKATVGVRVTAVRRRAKLLLIELSNGFTLAVHLKMTGRFLLQPAGRALGKHAHVVFRLDRGQELVFEDLRKFGFLRLYPTAKVPAMLAAAKYGPEPLEKGFTARQLSDCLDRRPNSRVKAALLDQTCIAGIGNIYADESLWRARIRPERRVGSLKPRDISALYRAIRQSLRLAVRHRGTSSEDFLDLYGQPGDNAHRLKAYGRTGQPCPRCGQPLVKSKVAGRGTHWCRTCQK